MPVSVAPVCVAVGLTVVVAGEDDVRTTALKYETNEVVCLDWLML